MNVLGKCLVCGHDVMQVGAFYENTGDGRVDGTPRSVVGFSDDAFAVSLVRVDGTTVRLTLHERCASIEPARLVRMARQIQAQESLCLDPAYRAARGGKPMNESQREATTRSVLGWLHSPPLGVVSAHPWKEYTNGRAG